MPQACPRRPFAPTTGNRAPVSSVTCVTARGVVNATQKAQIHGVTMHCGASTFYPGLSRACLALMGRA